MHGQSGEDQAQMGRCTKEGAKGGMGTHVGLEGPWTIQREQSSWNEPSHVRKPAY